MCHCIVVDDEDLASERIPSFEEGQDSWQVNGQSAEYKEAESLLLKHWPFVSFMDKNIIRILIAGYRVHIFISVERS
jgi:two-component system LytT family response regulator